MSRPVEIIVSMVLYSAIMFGLAWVLWQVLPGFINWADETLGMWAVRGLIVLLILGAYSVAYFAGRRSSDGPAVEFTPPPWPRWVRIIGNSYFVLLGVGFLIVVVASAIAG